MRRDLKTTLRERLRPIAASFFALGMLVAMAAPAMAPASPLHAATAFSPITGSGIGATFHLPRGVAVDEASGNIFVSSGQQDNAIYVMNSEGGTPVGVAAPYKITGVNFGIFFPTLAVDNSALSPSKGTLYATDVGNDVVRKFILNVGAEQYEAAGTLDPGHAPEGLAIDKDGNVFVACPFGGASNEGTITKFSPSGALLWQVETAAGSHPRTVAVDGAGDVFIANHFQAFVYSSDGLGGVELGSLTELPTPNEVSGLTVDPATNILYLTAAGEVVEFDADSLIEKGTFTFPGIEQGVSQLAINHVDGLIYVVFQYEAISQGVVALGLNGPMLADTGVTSPSGVRATGATLNGVVNPQGVAVSECKFEELFPWSSSLPCEGSLPTDGANHPVSAQISGLDPATTHFYRMVTVNANGTVKTAIHQFTTEPLAKTTAASALTPSTATLNGVVHSEGSPLSECKFEYGLTTEYEATLPCSPAAGSIPADFEPHSVSADLSGLLVGTTYHFRLVASGGLGTENGKDLTFTTLGPSVNGKSFSVLGDTSVTLEALINPRGLPSAYHFEYGSQGPCESNPCASVPIPDAEFGGGNADVKVSQAVKGLTPDTTYHYRVVVSNSDGVGHSTEGTFTTYEATSGFPPCPDESFRAGKPSAKLPDCRVYEQASPIDKNGNHATPGTIYKSQASPSGDAITSQTYGGLPGGEGAQAYPIYASQRGPAGWSTQGLLPSPSFGDAMLIMGWTPDLAYSFTQVGLAGSDDVGGVDRAIVMRSSAAHAGTRITPYLDKAEYAFAGASADDSKLFFEAKGPGLNLTGNAATSKDNLYVYEPASEELSLVGVLPGGATPSQGSFAGPFDWWSATSASSLAGGGALGPNEKGFPGQFGYYTQEMHAISADGSRAFFTAGATGQVYVREGIGGEEPETARVSTSQRATPDPHGAKPAIFTGATPDGSKAFFTSCQKLTDDSTAHSTAANACDTPSQGQDLYAYDTESRQLEDLTVDAADPQGAEVIGVLGASDDGSYVYFVANGDLDGVGGQAEAGDCRRIEDENVPGVFRGEFAYTGSCSLYAWHAGVATFVATLKLSGAGSALSDASNWMPRGEFDTRNTARVSSDGQTVVFRSQSRLTGYDNLSTNDACSQNSDPRCAELYHYRLGDSAPTCVTCNPTGAPPTGAPSLDTFESAIFIPAHPIGKRFVSASGDQVFFETTDKLVAADVNGDHGCPLVNSGRQLRSCQDVYEWEAPEAGSCSETSPAFSTQDGGCLYLLSSGTSSSPSFLGDASVSGDDVFIFTADQLVPSDKDRLSDVYDVKVGGGLASQNEPPPPPPCEGQGCRSGAGSTPPVSQSAGSAGFSGPGNSPAKHCPKGKTRKGAKCVKSSKKHHKRHAKRRAGAKQGGHK
jgi:SMP-30/gluconolaconase/LRE-like protein